MPEPTERHYRIGQLVGFGVVVFFLGMTVFTITYKMPRQQENFYHSIDRRLEAIRLDDERSRENERAFVRRERARDASGALQISKSIESHSTMMREMQLEVIKALKAMTPKDKPCP